MYAVQSVSVRKVTVYGAVKTNEYCSTYMYKIYVLMVTEVLSTRIITRVYVILLPRAF